MCFLENLYQDCGRTIQNFFGLALVITGTLRAIVASFLPMWKVTISNNGDTATTHILKGGLFFTCQVSKSIGWNQCDNNELLQTPVKDLHMVRNLLIFSILVGFMALYVSYYWCQREFCNCNYDTMFAQVTNVTISLCVGIMFMVAGLLYMVSMIWAGSIIRGFHNSVATEGQVECGDAISWTSGFFCLVGGGIICRTSINRCCYDRHRCCQLLPIYHTVEWNTAF